MPRGRPRKYPLPTRSPYEIEGNTPEKNPLYPLPPDYETLTPEGQRLARLSVVSDQSTPYRFAYAWSFFRRYYLIDTGSGFSFYKNYMPSPSFHYQAVYDMAAHQYNILAAPRGSSKCIRWDQRVLTSCGYKNIQDINPGDYVLSCSAEGKLGWKPVVRKINSGVKSLLKVTLKSGHSVVSSEDHRFITGDGWKPLGSIIPQKDYMALPSHVDYTYRIEKGISTEDSRAIGILLGDGSVIDCLRLTTADHEIVDFFAGFAETKGWKFKKESKYGYRCSRKIKGSGYSTVDWLKEVGIFGSRSKDKRIPQCIWNSDGSSIAACLQGLFDTDGSVSQTGRIYYVSISYGLARDVQLLLLQLGIRSRLSKLNTQCGRVRSIAWRVSIDSLLECSKYKKKIGFGIIRKQERIKESDNLSQDTYDIVPFTKENRDNLSITPYFLRKNRITRVDNHYNITRKKLKVLYETTGQQWLKDKLEQEIYWDKVVSIEKQPEDNTFDLEIGENHNFLCEGVFVHNSTVLGLEIPLMDLCARKEGFDIALCLAKESMVTTRFDKIQMQISENPRILEDFGNLVPKKGHGIWNKENMRLTNGNRLQGLSTTGRKRGERPDLFIMDDPEFDADNEHSQDLLIEKFESLLFQQVIPMMKEGCGIFWIGTIINRKSFLYRAFSGEDDRFNHWNRSLLAAGTFNETTGHFDNLLWPEAMSDEFLLQRKAEMSPALFSAEYLNAPVSRTDRLLRLDPELGTYTLDNVTKDNLRTFNPFNLDENIHVHYRTREAIEDPKEAQVRKPGVVDRVEPYPKFLAKLYRITLVDYAYTVSSTSDYSDIMTVGIDPQGTVWVLDNFLGRVDPAGINSIIMEQAARWQSHMICPESVAIQYALVDSLNILLRNTEINPGDLTSKVIPLKYPGGVSKAERIAGLQKFFNMNRIKVPCNPCHRERWEWTELTHQINDFTLSLELLPHDDAVDTLSMFQYTPYNWGSPVSTEPTILGPLDRLAQGQIWENTIVGKLPLLYRFNMTDIPDEVLMSALAARIKANQSRGCHFVQPRTAVDNLRPKTFTESTRSRLLGPWSGWGERAVDAPTTKKKPKNHNRRRFSL